MNKKILIISLLFNSIILNVVFARPPSEIDLTYDADKKTLHIEMIHVTNNLREHHIRRIFIYQNDQEVQDIRLVTQTTASMLIQDVPLEAKEGDVIRIKAICKEGGYKEEELTIREEKKEDK